MMTNLVIIIGIVVFFLIEKITQSFLNVDSHNHTHNHGNKNNKKIDSQTNKKDASKDKGNKNKADKP